MTSTLSHKLVSQPCPIRVEKIPGKVRGVLATQEISAGTLVEAAPVSTIPPEQLSRLKDTEIFRYYFVPPSEYLKSNPLSGYLVFGLASLCNHSQKANARVEWVKNEVGLWAHLVAKRDIEAGEEVTLFYTNINEYPDAGSFV